MAESGQSSPAAVSPDDASALEEIRRRIDEIDRGLLEHLNQRARLVQEVGKLKRDRGHSVWAPGREREIVERLAAANSGPFPDAALRPVFAEIISATRSLEQVLEVAYLGPRGTFAHQVASRQFGHLAHLAPCPSISDVFGAVERGKASLGVVPVENTTEGIVTETFDAFVEADVTICGEALPRISHELLSRSGRLEDVERVASHPQPLAQCRGWLDRHLRAAERIETPSTANAAQRAAEDGSVAAIGSTMAGEVYGLQTIETAIEDRRDNTTRFLLIGKTPPPPSANDLTLAVFTLRKDESGALYRLLEPFARCGVNLTSIQLRPMRGKPWEYLFFLEFEGHRSESRVAEALEGASGVARSQRVLGSFPRSARERSARRETAEE